MPLLIEHIDALARKKQRDVLFVTFKPKSTKDDFFSDHYDWENDEVRQQICAWLTKHQIPWQYCGHVASENYMGPYQGQIFIDVPFDEQNEQYQQVRDHFENPDGSMKFDTVTFWVLPLEIAMKNKHHDEPGFWERWAENF